MGEIKVVIHIKDRPVVITVDPSDDKFIHCAKAGKASAIVSGDQHLLSLKSYQKIKIFTPTKFLENL